MLRMFTKRQSSKAMDKRESQTSVCTDEEDPSSNFPALVLQLTAAEEQLKHASNLLVRHSNALAELVQTTAEIQALTSKQFNHQTSENAMVQEQKIFNDSIDKFRTSAIAPLQSLLASFPQLKHRMDHRKSALTTWRRYIEKINDIVSKGGDAARLQRNRLKCAAAEERFHQLDNDVQREVGHILSLDMSLLLEVPIFQLVEAQQIWVSTMQTASKHLRQSLNQPSKQPSKQTTAESSHEPQQDGNQPSFSAHGGSLVVEKPSQPLHANDMEILDKTRSLRPKKHHTYGTRTWQMHQHVKKSLAQGMDIMDSVALPLGFSKEEWIAVHAIDFYNEVSLLYGTMSDFCTDDSCPQMSAGPCYTYLWAAPDEHGAAPTPCTAPMYVTNLMAWIDTQICDPSVFPDHGFESNKAFAVVSRTIFKRLFRVYAHIYHHHVGDFMALHADAHLNWSFKRFICFVIEFDLIQVKELNALGKLISQLIPSIASKNIQETNH